jgi:transcriptional regulator, XRE family
VIDMTIGKRLRKIRIEQGLTTVKLGMRANISQAMISRIENDRANPTIDKVVSLARALNIPISKLLDEDVTLYQSCTNLKKEEQDLLHYYRLVDTSEKAMIINVARVTYEARINILQTTSHASHTA